MYFICICYCVYLIVCVCILELNYDMFHAFRVACQSCEYMDFCNTGSQSNIYTFMLPGPTLGFIDVYISCKCLFVFSHLHVSNYTMSSTFELKSSSVQHSTRPPKLIICIVQKNLLKHIMANSGDYT